MKAKRAKKADAAGKIRILCVSDYHRH